MSPRRTIKCSGCGTAGPNHGRGMCRRCYYAQPEQRAKLRRRLMIRRCTQPTDPAWKWYGARGIKVCDRWLNSFEDYYRDVGDAPEGMSLDRIDNDGDYEPGNVRWATPRQQVENKRDGMASKTHCIKGHPYDEINTYLTPRGTRDCRTCRRAHSARSRQRRHEQAVAS